MKFRVWDSFNGEYLYSDTCTPVGLIKNKHAVLANFFRYVAELEFAENNPVVEKGFGSKDKKGKEIYEGDILKKWSFSNELYVVKYGKQDIGHDWLGVGFFTVKIKYPEDQENIFGGEDVEIIGNIHETPELLEEKNWN